MTQTLSQRPLVPAAAPAAPALRNPQVGFSRLRCRECGAEYQPVAKHVCDLCFGPLEVVYDYD
ncbi:threonine synthase, partial [Synechococcus sp. H60.3]